MSEQSIIHLIEGELKKITTAKAKLEKYRDQLVKLYTKVERELGKGVSLSDVTCAIEAPTKEAILGVMTPKETLSMIELRKRLGGHFTSGQLRRVIAELANAGLVSKSGQMRSTTYCKK